MRFFFYWVLIDGVGAQFTQSIKASKTIFRWFVEDNKKTENHSTIYSDSHVSQLTFNYILGFISLLYIVDISLYVVYASKRYKPNINQHDLQHVIPVLFVLAILIRAQDHYQFNTNVYHVNNYERKKP